MNKGITICRKVYGTSRRKPVVVYKGFGEEAEMVGNYESIQHASNALKIHRNTIGDHILNKTPFKGYWFYYRGTEPYFSKSGAKPEILPSEDLPVIGFFKDDDAPVARYKSVTFLHKCIGRSIKQILGWLKGARCSDPDCYYKYEKDCTAREIAAVNKSI